MISAIDYLQGIGMQRVAEYEHDLHDYMVAELKQIPGIRLFGEVIPVQASVHTINGFSAHADQRELLDWYRRTGGARITYLVHGDEEAMAHFATLLGDTEVRMPALHADHDL